MADETWFKAKTHGYGASPTSWKGWLAIALYALVMIGFSLLFLGAIWGTHVGAVEWLVWLVGVSIATVAFIMLARRKTDGDWRWRWGGK